MAKYLLTGSYTPEGTQGLAAEGGSGRKAALARALQSVGGTLEAMYFAHGDIHFVLIADVPDVVSMMALGLAAGGTGSIAGTTVTQLATAEEMDAACRKAVAFRPAGAASV